MPSWQAFVCGNIHSPKAWIKIRGLFSFQTVSQATGKTLLFVFEVVITKVISTSTRWGWWSDTWVWLTLI